MAASVRKHQVKVGSVELRAFNEAAHHVGHHVAVNGVHDANGLVLVGQLAFALHFPRDAARIAIKLFSNVAAVARSGEVENHALSLCILLELGTGMRLVAGFQ